MPSYLSPLTLKTFLGISVTTYDAVLELILSGVEQAVETYIGRGPLAYASRTLYLSTAGEIEITLGPIPLMSVDDVTSVYEDAGGYYGQATNAFASTSLLTRGTDYVVAAEEGTNRCRLRRIGTVWPYQSRSPVGFLSSLRAECPGCVKVVASLGFTASAPADVIAACYGEAAARWASGKTGIGLQTSAGIDGYTIAFTPFNSAQQQLGNSPFLTETLLKACRPYRRIPVAR